MGETAELDVRVGCSADGRSATVHPLDYVPTNPTNGANDGRFPTPDGPRRSRGGRSAGNATVWTPCLASEGRYSVKRPNQDRYFGLPRALAGRLPTGRCGGSPRPSGGVSAGLDRSADRGRLSVATVATPGGRLPGRDRMSRQGNLGLQGRSGGATTAERREVQGDQDLPCHVGRRSRVDSTHRSPLPPHMVAACRVRHHRQLHGGLE